MYGKSVKARSSICKTYKIKKELGRGGNGAVYMAWHKRLRKNVVIKTVKGYSAAAIGIHRNEAEALKNVKSLYIPQVFDFLIEKDHSFTVIEYIKGDSFDKFLKRGHKFSEAQIIKWYIQLASALDAIHKLDICHRDIKPANIILTENEDICLIDFNSAFVNGNTTGLTSRSMGYASPEQYKLFKLCNHVSAGEKVANASRETLALDSGETVLLINDCKTETGTDKNPPAFINATAIDWKLSDIYSLGATMLHLLTGKRPPVRPEDVKRIPSLNDYSQKILKIIEKSMRSDPLERYASAASLTCYLSD